MRWKSRLPFGDLRLGAEIIGLKGPVETIASAESDRVRFFGTGRPVGSRLVVSRVSVGAAALNRRGRMGKQSQFGKWRRLRGRPSRVKLVYCSGSGALAFPRARLSAASHTDARRGRHERGDLHAHRGTGRAANRDPDERAVARVARPFLRRLFRIAARGRKKVTCERQFSRRSERSAGLLAPANAGSLKRARARLGVTSVGSRARIPNPHRLRTSSSAARGASFGSAGRR